MDYLAEMGALALGSRLKRLSERLAQGVASIYAQQNLPFEPRWFPVFRLLGMHGQTAITDIASAIDVTHPAVNQVAGEMLAANLIVQVVDPDDKRRRLLSLSKKGRQLYEELDATWRALLISISDAIDESGHDLLKALTALEGTLDRSDLPARFVQNERLLETEKVNIRAFTPRDAESFRRLNEMWITKYFAMEEEDVAVLSSPQKIIDEGGSVIFACLGEKIIGTCALIKVSKRTFEIGKMAVHEAYQGLGAGQLLLEACVDQARRKGAKQVTLETNTKLASAVRLYTRAGFKPERHGGGRPSKYARVDLVMKLDLASVPAKTR